MSNRP